MTIAGPHEAPLPKWHVSILVHRPKTGRAVAWCIEMAFRQVTADSP